MIDPSKISFVRDIDFIPWFEFSGFVESTGTLQSQGNGNPVPGIISAGTDITGLLMVAGDTIQHLMRVPNKWDRNHPIYVRVVYSSATNTPTDTFTWIVTANGIIPNEVATASGLIANAGLAALDTPIPVDTYGSSSTRLLMVTENGVMNPGFLGDNDHYLNLEVELDALDAAENTVLLGLEIEHTIRWGLQRRQKEGEVWQP